MSASLRLQRLVALCIAGAVMLNFPLLALWDVETTVFGLPLLPLAIFVSWAVLIACAAWIVRVKRQADGAQTDSELPDDG